MNQMPKLLWEPDAERIERATLTRYTRWLSETRGLDFDDYEALWRWSVDDLDAFWASIWEYFEVQAEVPYARVLGSRAMPGAEWFPGARLSFAGHVFAGKDDDAVAIRHASEAREGGEWTWADLRAHSAELAAGLRALEIGRASCRERV